MYHLIVLLLDSFLGPILGKKIFSGNQISRMHKKYSGKSSFDCNLHFLKKVFEIFEVFSKSAAWWQNLRLVHYFAKHGTPMLTPGLPSYRNGKFKAQNSLCAKLLIPEQIP
jgi:hypothetical protein